MQAPHAADHPPDTHHEPPGLDDPRIAGPAPEDGSADDVTRFRTALAAQLHTLRVARGMTVNNVAEHMSITAGWVADFESGKRRPSLTRLLQLCSVYDTGLVDFLESLVDRVRPAGTGELDKLAESMVLLGGLTPRDVVTGTLHLPPRHPRDVYATDGSVPHVDSEAHRAEWGEEPLGPLLAYRRHDDPVRRAGGRRARRQYESGSSIRALALLHRLSFGTTRTLLRDAGADMRKAGGSHPVGPSAPQGARPDPSR